MLLQSSQSRLYAILYFLRMPIWTYVCMCAKQDASTSNGSTNTDYWLVCKWFDLKYMAVDKVYEMRASISVKTGRQKMRRNKVHWYYCHFECFPLGCTYCTIISYSIMRADLVITYEDIFQKWMQNQMKVWYCTSSSLDESNIWKQTFHGN